MLATTLSRRVQVPNSSIPGVWVVALIVQVLGKYMMLDTWTLRVLAWSYSVTSYGIAAAKPYALNPKLQSSSFYGCDEI